MNKLIGVLLLAVVFLCGEYYSVADAASRSSFGSKSFSKAFGSSSKKSFSSSSSSSKSSKPKSSFGSSSKSSTPSKDTFKKSDNTITRNTTTPRSSFGSSSVSKKPEKTYNNVDYSKYKKPSYSSSSTVDSKPAYKYRSSQSSTYTPPPVMYNTFPSFGIFETVLLMELLQRDKSWFYHNKDNPDVKKFLSETENLSKTDENLAKELEELKVSLAKLEEEKPTVDINYIPVGFEQVETNDKVGLKDFLEKDSESTSTLWKWIVGLFSLIGMMLIITKLTKSEGRKYPERPSITKLTKK